MTHCYGHRQLQSQLHSLCPDCPRKFQYIYQKTTTTFLDLPRELRDQIYELSLVSDRVVDLRRLVTVLSCDAKLGIAPALLRASRQIHSEAIEIMYSLNTFQATIFLGLGPPY